MNEFIKRIWWKGSWRDASDHIWTDNWNFEDEIKYRKKVGISMIHDRD